MDAYDIFIRLLTYTGIFLTVWAILAWLNYDTKRYIKESVNRQNAWSLFHFETEGPSVFYWVRPFSKPTPTLIAWKLVPGKLTIDDNVAYYRLVVGQQLSLGTSFIRDMPIGPFPIGPEGKDEHYMANLMDHCLTLIKGK